jgi:formate-dependent nitrite reductase membrane component NrfD
MFKYWSPMSYGSWILLIFSALGFLNFVAALWGDRPGLLAFLPRLLTRGFTGTLFQILVLVFSYGLASYTGALLNATNQLFWSDTPFMGALFFTSAVGTGISALILIIMLRRRVNHALLADLETADNWAMGLELLLLVATLISFGALASHLLGSIYGITLLVGTLLLGLIIPLLLHFRPVLGRSSPLAAAGLAIAGGFALRWAIVMAAQGVYVYGR